MNSFSLQLENSGGGRGDPCSGGSHKPGGHIPPRPRDVSESVYRLVYSIYLFDYTSIHTLGTETQLPPKGPRGRGRLLTEPSKRWGRVFGQITDVIRGCRPGTSLSSRPRPGGFRALYLHKTACGAITWVYAGCRPVFGTRSCRCRIWCLIPPLCSCRTPTGAAG